MNSLNYDSIYSKNNLENSDNSWLDGNKPTIADPNF